MKTTTPTPDQPRRALTCTRCGQPGRLYPGGVYCDHDAPKPRPGVLGLAYRKEPRPC